MVNHGFQDRADAAREDLKGIGELPPESFPGGKVIAQLQPAPAGEQAHADVGARRTTPGRSRTRSTSSTPRKRIVPVQTPDETGTAHTVTRYIGKYKILSTYSSASDADHKR